MLSFFGTEFSVLTVYWILLLFGLVVATVSWLLEGLFDFMDDGAIMPAVGVFILLFGGTGVISILLFGASAAGSVIYSISISTIGASGFYFFFMKVLLRQENTMTDSRQSIEGIEAEVSLPSDGESLGQVTYVTPSGRSSWPARTADGTPLKQGQFVRIVRCIGTTCIVEPLKQGTKQA